MPAPRYRTSSYRKVFKRTPGGRLVVHYEKRRPKRAVCGLCGKPLHGVPRERPVKMRNMAKSKKRPNRPFGGNLCASCMRKVIKKVYVRGVELEAALRGLA